MAEPTKILHCMCAHEDQDKRYGKSKRLHNYCAKKGLYRCTVCKTERS